MSDHLERVIEHRRREGVPKQITGAEVVAEEAASFDALERVSVYLELIDHAETRAQALAGMAGTALGVFFAAFIAAFVVESGTSTSVLKVADLVSEILFVVGAFLLLRCIFQSLRPGQIENPWDEEELVIYWRRVDLIHDNAARNFWLGTVLLALSISILVAADVLIDLGFFASSMGG